MVPSVTGAVTEDKEVGILISAKTDYRFSSCCAVLVGRWTVGRRGLVAEASEFEASTLSFPKKTKFSQTESLH